MKRLTALIIAAVMIFSLCACGGASAPKTENNVNTPTTSTTPSAPTNSDTTADEIDTEPETEDVTETESEPISRTITVSYEQPFYYDWDKDGTDEVFTWGENAISNEGVLTVHFETDFSKDKIIETQWLIYDGMIAFVDLDGDGTEEVFLTGSDGTYNFVTYAYKMENGTLAEIPIGTDPAFSRASSLKYVPGCLQDTLDENGYLQITGNIDLLGTFLVTRPFDMKDGAFCAVENVVIPFDMDNAAPTTLMTDLPCTFTSAPNEDIRLTDADVMSAYSVVAMTGVRYEGDGTAAAFFATGDGMCGAFRVNLNDWTINGVSIYEAFDSLLILG